LETASDDERRTAVVRFSSSTDPDDAATRLREMGAQVQVPGQGSVTCVVDPKTLRALADAPWVVSIEEPRRMFPTAAPGATD
jgi:hypothetical protein